MTTGHVALVSRELAKDVQPQHCAGSLEFDREDAAYLPQDIGGKMGKWENPKQGCPSLVDNTDSATVLEIE